MAGHRLRLLWLLASALLTPATAFPSNASAFCLAVDHLADLAHGNFVHGTVNQARVHEVASVLPGTNQPAKCRIVAKPDRKSHMCMWTFPYRDQAASSGFDALSNAVGMCIGEGAAGQQDQRVNHPDFYDARSYHRGNATVTVSIKDKAALEHTFVFLRVEAGQ